MNQAVKDKLIEILTQAYGGEVRETYDACVAAQAELGGTEDRPVAAYRRCLTDGTVRVEVIPLPFHGAGGNDVVRFVFELKGLSGAVFGSVNAEAATQAMKRWVVTEADVVTEANTATSRQVLEGKILAIQVAALEPVPCP
ncbi:hypothetical protein [Methylorubrum thiocyanatum]|uniref:Uncharacterized protein n=1 Tax=Methylorubrum thiocyanatum TaxID=47958 RepID=A0AA40S528_9HYPH|nr:hypothetical protein [Methylorubrum thiocyanatum]MBA8914723.1 hypothetical protein [Methylorubrum thiocyanatum]GJE79136.1 hypothetical protein CJNNKLLH_0462 [Methylorubrum thiocyanatum]